MSVKREAGGRAKFERYMCEKSDRTSADDEVEDEEAKTLRG